MLVVENFLYVYHIHISLLLWYTNKHDKFSCMSHYESSEAGTSTNHALDAKEAPA